MNDDVTVANLIAIGFDHEAEHGSDFKSATMVRPMRKPMTLKEALLDMARKWDEPGEYLGECFLLYGNKPGFWICGAEEEYGEEISGKIKDMIIAHDFPKTGSTDFWWPVNSEDAKERAAFLRKMAEKCEEKQ